MATTLNITISKSRVMDEVQKTTEYIGKKATSEKDPDAYERISAVDADLEQLDRYWMEACSGATTDLSHWLIAADSQLLGHHYDPTRDYHVELSLPLNWQDNLAHATKEALMGYLVNIIVSKWLIITLPSQAEPQAASGAGCMALVSEHLLARKRPAGRLSGWNGSGGSGGGGGGGEEQGGITHVILTQEEYDNLATIDEDTIYLIYEDV